MKLSTLLVLLFIGRFTIVSAHVGITNPSSSVELKAGDIFTIEWEVIIEHNTKNWDILFSSDDGKNWETIQLDIPVDTKSYNWMVPNRALSKAKIKIIQDNEGTNYEAISSVFTISITTKAEQEKIITPIIYPNPLNTFSTLKFHNPLHTTHTFYLYNYKGEMLRMEHITDNQLIIERGNLSKGIYFYLLKQKDTIKTKGKLAVE